MPANLPRAIYIAGSIVILSHLINDFAPAPNPWAIVWKAAGVVILALYCFSRRAPVAGAAMLLCAAGDVFLEINGMFVYGMAAFGLGHVGYIACFAGWMRRLGVNRRDLPVAVGIIAISLGMLVWFFPDMGSLTVPGLAYQAIITTMVVTALLARAPMTARLGAVVFMLSDSLIALGLYKHIGVPPGSVWITYAIAQMMIAWGLGRPYPKAAAPRAPNSAEPTRT